MIMGRKTYDSLPTRFRPLPRRLNVIITRDESGLVRERAVAEWKAARRRELEKERQKQIQESGGESSKAEISEEAEKEEPSILVSNTIESALDTLHHSFDRFSQNGLRRLGNVFVIGGAEIYASVLRFGSKTEEGQRLRIVLTDVRRPSEQVEGPASESSTNQVDPGSAVDGFECDTFFPIDDLQGSKEWRMAATDEVSEWVGEAVPEGWIWEGDVAIRIIGFQRQTREG